MHLCVRCAALRRRVGLKKGECDCCNADALLELRPGAALLDLDDEVENINEVLESFLAVLVTLSAQERTKLLLAPRLPQFRNNNL